MFKIEQDQVVKATRGRRAKYPFGAMAPGDVFLIPAVKRRREMGKKIQRVRAAASKYGRKYGIEFYTVRVTEGLLVVRKAAGNLK